MSVRKIFPGGMVKPVNIPNIDFTQFRVASSSASNIDQRLNRLLSFAIDEGEKVAVEEGTKYAASNPISVDDFYNADPEEREKLLGGDKITSYGKAVRIAQINLLATDISIAANKDFQNLKIVATSTNMSNDLYEQGLTAIVDGYSQSLMDVDAEAAITVKSQLATKANTYYNSYLDDKIKDISDIKATQLTEWGNDQLETIADEIKVGTTRVIENGDETTTITIEEHLELKKKEYFDKISTNPDLKEFAEDWSANWDARVALELKNFLYTKHVDTQKNRSTMKAASQANQEIQNETFFGDEEAQRIFKNLDSEEQKKFKQEVREWKTNIINSREKDNTGAELDLANEKKLLEEEYLAAETSNDVAKANEIVEQAYKIDRGLGNEFKKLLNGDLKGGLFFDPEKEVDLYFDLYNGNLTVQEITNAFEAGSISKDTAINLRSQVVAFRKDSYAKADLELRKQLAIPEPNSITPAFIETKLYREYQKRSLALLQYYNDNPEATPAELLAEARAQADDQIDQKIQEEDFNKKRDMILKIEGSYKMNSSEWDKYFQEFYKDGFVSVSSEFFVFSDKSKIGDLIKELEELKLMEDGVQYVPSTVPPEQLEVDEGTFGFGGAKEFKRPEGITNTQIDELIDILEFMRGGS